MVALINTFHSVFRHNFASRPAIEINRPTFIECLSLIMLSNCRKTHTRITRTRPCGSFMTATLSLHFVSVNFGKTVISVKSHLKLFKTPKKTRVKGLRVVAVDSWTSISYCLQVISMDAGIKCDCNISQWRSILEYQCPVVYIEYLTTRNARESSFYILR